MNRSRYGWKSPSGQYPCLFCLLVVWVLLRRGQSFFRFRMFGDVRCLPDCVTPMTSLYCPTQSADIPNTANSSPPQKLLAFHHVIVSKVSLPVGRESTLLFCLLGGVKRVNLRFSKRNSFLHCLLVLACLDP